MSSFFFWNSWAKEYRYTFYLAAFLFIASLLFLWFAYFQGADGVIQWHTLQEQKVLDINVHTFRLGPFEINVPGESYLILEFFQGGQVKPNVAAAAISLSFLALGVVIILSVLTTLEKFWYFVAMALFILFVITLRFDVLAIFGVDNHLIPGIILALYILPSFYFNRIRSSTPLIIRLLVFLVITVVLCVVIALFSRVGQPFYHLFLTSFPATLVLSVLFVVMVAHEIVGGFAHLVTQGSSRSLQHFAIVCGIYLANVFITALHEMGVIQWNFIYVNIYLLLTISAILGLWGFRQREVLYNNIIAFYPFGALLFLALGTICFITTAQLMANANDPGLKVMRDIVIFSHAGYGLIFLLYILSNFGQIMMDNLSISKVLYLPRRMPYFTFRFAGLIATLAFVFSSNWRTYVYNGTAAFYNIAGDMYTLLDNRAYAESFYLQGQKQGFQNHRSNYVLGSMKASRFNFEEAEKYYDQANGRRPSEFSLTNAGNIFLRQSDYFTSIKKYKRGLETLPSSAILANNLGVAYAKVHKIDSATMFLNKARSSSKIRHTAETNFFAMAALEYVPLQTDSILKVFDTESPGTLSNALALSTLFKIPFETPIDPLANKKLNLYTATLLNNYIIQNAKNVDTTFVNEAFAIASDPDNDPYSEALKSSLAYAYYHHGNISKAMEILAEQVYLSQNYQGKFNYIMGLWALEQNNPERASTFFTYADTYDYKDARFYNAIALTESGRLKTAIAAWDSVSVYGDAAQKEIAQRIRRILTIPSADALQLKDPEKYQFCRYRITLADSVFFNKLSNTFDNANYKAQALLDISKKYLEADQIIPAIHNYHRIAGLKLTDRALYEETRHYELRLLAHRAESRALATAINKGIEFTAARNLEKIFYTAIIHEANGDTTQAKKNYTILANYNPYFEEGILAAYNFFLKTQDKNLYPYSILAEAIQVNANSLRLLRAYRDEAIRVGLDDYAISATQRIQELERYQE